jgi:hypothetical protein
VLREKPQGCAKDGPLDRPKFPAHRFQKARSIPLNVWAIERFPGILNDLLAYLSSGFPGTKVAGCCHFVRKAGVCTQARSEATVRASGQPLS